MRALIRDRVVKRRPKRQRAGVVLALLVLAAASGCAAISARNGVVPVKLEGGLLVNLDGMTLYVFDRDRAAGARRSVCLGQCALNWPPLAAAEDGSPSEDYEIISRADGTKQWAYKGRPLYLWIKDHKPGDKTGDGLNKVWHVAKP